MNSRQPDNEAINARNRRTAVGAAGMAVVMIGAAYAAVPLYDLFCEITGLNGKTGGPYVYEEASVERDRSRLSEVHFVTNTNEGMVWKFWPEKGGVRVNPGAANSVSFYVKNTTDQVMVGQAIPSVVPGAAAEFFHKTECFCFNQQLLSGGSDVDMPLKFIVDRDLPDDVKTITLSYTLFDVTETGAIQVDSLTAL